MHLWVFVPAAAMAVICAAALLWGDRPLRLAGGVIAACWLWGLAARMLSHTFMGTVPVQASDLVASVALAATWLTARLERLDLFVIAALQGLQCLLEFSHVEVAGHPMYIYYVEYNVLNLAMLAALLCATIVHLVLRGARNRAAAGNDLC